MSIINVYAVVSPAILALVVMLTVSRSESSLGVADRLVMGGLIWVAMVSWGGLLEGQGWADWLEIPKLALFVAGSLLVYADATWASPLGLAILAAGVVFAALYLRVRRPLAPARAAA